MNRLPLIAMLSLLSCHAPSWAPVHHGALFRSSLSPTFTGPKAGETTADAAWNRTTDSTEIRNRMASEALALLNDTNPAANWGDSDARRIMNEVLTEKLWHSKYSIEQMADRARACTAYENRRAPLIGDILLFHNQRDTNLNGRSDDWYTGCAIVTSVRGRHIEAVTRTGNLPRRIHIWLDGPATHMHEDRVVNSFVRVPDRSDPPDAEYLAGRLYAGHIDIERLASCTGAPQTTAHDPRTN